MKFVILVLLVTFTTVLTEKDNKCPKIVTQPSFDIKKYIGKWYQFSQFKGPTLKCVSQSLQLEGDTGIVGTLKGINPKSGKSNTQMWHGKLIQSEAKITITRTSFEQRSLSFSVLDTDYTSYAIHWSCEGDASKKAAWIWTRDQHASEKVVENAIQVLSQYGITREMLTKTDQTNCS